MSPVLRLLRGAAATARERVSQLRASRAPRGGRAPFSVERIGAGPIIEPGMAGLEGELGASITGPSLIPAPAWVEQPLGRYYLYFAHHHGRDIRLAFADSLRGPWRIHPRGVLALDDTAAREHIASPDVHVDHAERRLRMYFHGYDADRPARQVSFLATSPDGLRFTASREILAPYYLRVFEHEGWFYGVAKQGNRSGVLLRSRTGATAFEPGPSIIPRMRHAAVLKRGSRAWLFYTRIGDAPESLLAAPLELDRDWTSWRPGAGAIILAPERVYEGAGERVEPSVPGRARGRRCELRDPAIYVEGDRTFLLYAVAGEQGIAIAELGEAAS